MSTVPEPKNPVTESTWSLFAALRFFLALIVLSGHIFGILGYGGSFVILREFDSTAAVFAFLLLSGFSISHSVSTKPKGFYSRRCDRIIPVFVTCFIIAVIPYAIWGNSYSVNGESAPKMPQFIGDFFLLNNLIVDRLPTLGTAWSLSLEVVCYALAPLFMRMRSRYLLLICIASIIFDFNHGQWGFSNLPQSSYCVALATLLWIWVAGFLFYRHKNDQRSVFCLLFFAPLILSFCAGGGNIATFVASACLLIFHPKMPERWMKMANILGDLSYPLYLVHYPIICIFAGCNSNNGPLALICSLAASVVILYGVDYPFRSYRRKAVVAYNIPSL